MDEPIASVAYEVEDHYEAPPQRCEAPTWRVATVTCKKGHPLGGLFVLFRPKIDRNAFDKFKDWASGVRNDYELGMTSALGYLGPLNFDPAALARAWGIAFSSYAEEESCHFAAMADVVPKSYRFIPGQTYEMYFIQHPDPRVAWAIHQEIEKDEKKHGKPHEVVPDADGVLKIAEKGDEDPAMFLPQGGSQYGGWTLYRGMPSGQCDAVKAEVKKLQAHLGALRYIVGNDSWPYVFDPGSKDQPERDNEGVFDVRVMNAVFAFQRHSDAKSGARPFKLADKAVQQKQLAHALGLTRADRTKSPKKGGYVGPPGLEQDSWALLRGSEMKAPPAPHPEKQDGVVDASTAAAIESWLAKGLRKPGMPGAGSKDAILVYMRDPRSWGSWIRPEAGQALFAWSELAKLLGFSDGVCANHCYRSALTDVDSAGYGRAVASIHKSGLAVDVGMSQFVRGDRTWPVAYTQDRMAGTRAMWRVFAPSTQAIPGGERGKSTEARESAAQSLRRALASTMQGLSDTLGDTPPDPARRDFALKKALAQLKTKLDDDPRVFFDDFFMEKIQPWVYDAYDPNGGKPGYTVGRSVVTDDVTASQFHAIHEAFYLENQVIPSQTTSTDDLNKEVESLTKLHADALDDRKKRKLQARLDEKKRARDAAQADLDASKALHAQLAAAAEARFRAAEGGAAPPAGGWASFLDLTKLAALVGLSPIGSFSKGWQRVPKVMNATRELPVIATAIQKAKEARIENGVVAVTRAKAQLEWKLEKLDHEFMAQWSEKLPGLTRKDGAPKAVAIARPQLRVTLSIVPDREGDAEKVASFLDGFGDRYLHATPVVDEGAEIRKATEWAAYLRTTLLERVKAARTEMEKAAASMEERRKLLSERRDLAKKLNLAEERKAIAEESKTLAQDLKDLARKRKGLERETLASSFQPIFLLEYAPAASVEMNEIPVMPGDKVAVPTPGQPIGMEWWHFQRTDLILSVSYGGLLGAIGWQEECLLAGEIPQLHRRLGVGYSVDTLK